MKYLYSLLLILSLVYAPSAYAYNGPSQGLWKFSVTNQSHARGTYSGFVCIQRNGKFYSQSGKFAKNYGSIISDTKDPDSVFISITPSGKTAYSFVLREVNSRTLKGMFFGAEPAGRYKNSGAMQLTYSSQYCSMTHSRVKPDPGPMIHLKSVTYGANCQSKADPRLWFDILKQCNLKSSCSYRVDHRRIGDPAPGCRKNFQVRWACRTDRSAYINTRTIDPEASGKTIEIRCDG